MLILEHFFLDAIVPERMVVLRPPLGEVLEYHVHIYVHHPDSSDFDMCDTLVRGALGSHTALIGILQAYPRGPLPRTHYLRGDTINARLYTNEPEGLYGEEMRISEGAWQSVLRRVSKIIVRATSTVLEDVKPLEAEWLRGTRGCARGTLTMMWRFWEWFTSRIVLVALVLSIIANAMDTNWFSYSTPEHGL